MEVSGQFHAPASSSPVRSRSGVLNPRPSDVFCETRANINKNCANFMMENSYLILKRHFINIVSIWQYLQLWGTIQLQELGCVLLLNTWRDVRVSQWKKLSLILITESKAVSNISPVTDLVTDNYWVTREPFCYNTPNLVAFLINYYDVSINCPHV
jgi:hypothetical protein